MKATGSLLNYFAFSAAVQDLVESLSDVVGGERSHNFSGVGLDESFKNGN